MGAFLFTWNPAKYNWEGQHPGDLAAKAVASECGQSVTFGWSCSSSTLPHKGGRAFLTRLGASARGIFASGWIVRGSHLDASSDFGPRNVEVEWDVFLDPREPANLFDPSRIAGQAWAPQNSGAAIKPHALEMLEVQWLAHLGGLGRRPADQVVSDADGVEDTVFEAVEGELRRKLVNHRKRERALRNRKLAEVRARDGRLACEVCSFDFFEVFGIEYAEVHHLKLLAGDEPTTTRTSDLAVLCANCHRMAHHGPKGIVPLSKLRTLIRRLT